MAGTRSAAGIRTVRAGRRSLDIHRPDKVLFPADGNGKEYTKGDLVAYYRAIAPLMLPHLRGRPPLGGTGESGTFPRPGRAATGRPARLSDQRLETKINQDD